MSDIAQRLYQVRKTVTEMLVERGYIVSEDELSETLDDFKARFGEVPKRESLFRLHRHQSGPEQIMVFFPEKEKVAAGEIEEYYRKRKANSVQRGIIVLHAGITPFAKQLIAKMVGLVLELFK